MFSINACSLCQNPCSLGILTQYVSDHTTKRVLCLLGMPGSGKTTQTRFLTQGVSSLQVFHVGRFAKERGIPKQKDGSLLEGLDQDFLDYVGQQSGNLVVLDGFPRSLDQLSLLSETVIQKGWSLRFIHIAFPQGQEEDFSLSRQIGREGSENMIKMKGKIQRALHCDLAVVDRIRYLPIYDEISALDTPEQIQYAVAESLLTVSLDTPFLNKIVAEVQSGLNPGDSAYLSRSMVYTQLWNNRFGPTQEPNDIDVLSSTLCADMLTSRRYIVKSIVRGESDIRVLLSQEALSCYRIAIEVTSGGWRPIFLDPQDVYDTIDGRVSLYPDCVNDATAPKLHKIAQRYPMIRYAHFLDMYMNNSGYMHKPIEIFTDFESMNMRVQADEYGGVPDINYESSPSLIQAMDQFRYVFNSLKQYPSAPERRSNKNIVVSDSVLLSENAQNLDDNSFREYLYKQVYSRKGEKDHIIKHVVGYGYAQHLHGDEMNTEQKVTHQGFQLHQHLIEACLQLRTDHLSIDDRTRMVLRVAMLYHDTGKVRNSNTPGSHQGIGAKLFNRESLDFLTKEEVALGAYIIKWHDIFGRMCRGITEVGYKGAIHPCKVVDIIIQMPLDISLEQKLEIMYAIREADVKSVSSLRWLLGLMPSIRSVMTLVVEEKAGLI